VTKKDCKQGHNMGFYKDLIDGIPQPTRTVLTGEIAFHGIGGLTKATVDFLDTSAEVSRTYDTGFGLVEGSILGSSFRADDISAPVDVVRSQLFDVSEELG